ncbi:stage III sporulation protein AF [Domibacillus robiginosus]|uniref:stage III sporulation protein AF n=1 Tax=Domibacillus robiginosus TaxID=1071054 RepID=UPI00067DE059|nr:stage III sporulation protein AF [Domibacillus robiginosus]
MQSLFDWLSSVLALLLCASVVDMLLSESPMKKYVRLAAGLVIMAALVKPLFSADWSFSFSDKQGVSSFEQETKKQVEELSGVSELASDTYVNQTFQQEAEQIVSSFTSCELVAVEAEVKEEQVQKVDIQLHGQCPEQEIREHLAEKWNIGAHQLNMVMEKEETGGG